MIFRKLATTLLAFVLTGASPALGQDSLRERFQSPPDSAKPHTWWHWMNGYVSADGITKDLEAMKRAGLGGFQAFQIEYRMNPGPVKYLGKEWRELMKHTLKEADRLGLEVCFHQTAGWSSSGGPWITPEYSMQEVVWTEQKVSGPKTVEMNLPKPKHLRDNYFRDIAVLAFPTPESERKGNTGFRIENWKAKAGYLRDNHIKPDTRKVAPGDRIDVASIVDLTKQMDAKGRLKWQAPEGDWTIIRFGHAVCGLRNRPAPKEGRGNECDKMSKAAAAWHWKHTVQKVLDDAGPLAGKTLNNVLIDSYETGQQNWTKGFENDFKKRMGYDMIPYLPAVTGRVINDLDHTERFLWDFRRVIADMWTENYFGYFAGMCHEKGLVLSCEPYGVPGNMDNFAVADVVDIPMGEWWAASPKGPLISSPKMAASAAHTNGRRFAGAEAFTAGRMAASFINHPYSMKAQGDYFFSQGINRFIFHTFVHQPWPDEVQPGMTMGPWGIQNNRNNTWYEQGRAWNKYLARSQYLLQEGTFQADLCYYPGENAPQDAKLREDLQPAVPQGYDYDTISRANLMKFTVKDGRIVLPGLMEYRLLVMPDGPVRPEVLKKIHDLVKEGAHVVWAKPGGTPGLQGFPDADRTVKTLADPIWGSCDGKTVMKNAFGKGMIHWPTSLEPILKSLGVAPDVEFRPVQASAPTLYPGNGYAWIHRKIGSADVYLISNQQDVARQVDVVFRNHGKIPELWNAQTGEVRQAPLFQTTEDGRTLVRLSLEPAGAWFVVFEEQAAATGLVDVLQNGKFLFGGANPESASLSATKEGTVLVAWEAGRYEVVDSNGKRADVTVSKVPEAIDLSSDWSLQCPEGWGPREVALDRLVSWPQHSDPELKYFSGTGVYQKRFGVPADRLGDDYIAELDLGNVQIIAEVILNGKNLGILWKPPYKLDVSDLLKAEDNQLEIRVTNLWVNRMIGDEQHPAPEKYTEGRKPGELLVTAVPDWLKRGTARPKTQRKTFSTARFYTKDSPLLDSGLIGPVQLRFGAKRTLPKP